MHCSHVAIAACNKQLPAPSHHDRWVVASHALVLGDRLSEYGDL